MSDLALRLTSLLLRDHHPVSRRPGTVAGVVEWFGAMQAQDMASGLWSLGARLPAFTVADVTAALERREAIRTWPMRGTVHLVPPADARWMLDLMGARALARAAVRRETIGLTEHAAERGVEVLAEALRGAGRLTRAECLRALADAGIALAGQQAYHMLWYASQRGVTAIGPHVGKEQTFVLLDEWAPEPRRPSREEALALITTRYFRSHGPATVADLARWTGLPVRECRAGISHAGDTIVRVGESYVDPALVDAEVPELDDWLALPGFDEFMLGYQDRSLMLDAAHKNAIIPGGNGIFQATLVRGGRVVGTWKRSVTKKAVVVSAVPLVPFGGADRKNAEAALEPYAAFLGLPLVVRWPDA